MIEDFRALDEGLAYLALAGQHLDPARACCLKAGPSKDLVDSSLWTQDDNQVLEIQVDPSKSSVFKIARTPI